MGGARSLAHTLKIRYRNSMNTKLPARDKDYLEAVRPYENMWVALDKGGSKVLASAKNLKGLATHLKDSQKDYIVSRVLPADKALVPCLW